MDGAISSLDEEIDHLERDTNLMMRNISNSALASKCIQPSGRNPTESVPCPQISNRRQLFEPDSLLAKSIGPATPGQRPSQLSDELEVYTHGADDAQPRRISVLGNEEDSTMRRRRLSVGAQERSSMNAFDVDGKFEQRNTSSNVCLGAVADVTCVCVCMRV